MTQEKIDLLYIILPFLIPVFLTQSILLFIDAKKKGSYAWFWGIWGLIQFPLPTLFYLLLVIYPYHKKRKRSDS
ncbi:transcriptional regulator [Sutcliffiella rhizosphaerae]|uniref:Negative regulatory protein YxlD n=1 Tax=Sutcliffiella rhizosphaerae TaxID=2880967 RepID=A0ABM8YN83_9BACI|nr:transcriptional regulator [Sutcliffiella rhizosphaerae]CAG9621375.1 Negative regulatory protein YxlD [Sutcliffiella rhizosphaerae]